MNDEISQMRHAGFAAVSIGLSFFEMIAKYYYGFCKEGSSEEYFKKGIDLVYPNTFTEEVKLKLYKNIRCGMYHIGMFSGGVLSANTDNGISFQNNIIIVNPHKVGPDLINYLDKYVSEVINDNARSDHFEKRFDYDNHIKRKP